MSLSGYWSDLLSGQSFGSTDAAVAQGQSLDDQLKAQNQKLADQGVWTQAQLDAANANIDANAISATDVAASTTGGFASGLVDAAGNPIQTFNNGLAWEGSTVGSAAGSLAAGAANAVKGTLGSFFPKIPIWVWVVAIAGAALWFFWPHIVKKTLSARG